jgi:hypothetical protein
MAHPRPPIRDALNNTKDELLGCLAPLGVLIMLAFGGLQLFHLNRDLDSIQDRAQIAANPQDMLVYLRTMRDNMVTYGATSGHTALILKTPANDLALHFQAVKSVIGRLEQIQGLPVDSAAYQTALDDLRGVLREMPRIASGVFWVQYGWWLALLGLVCWGIIAAD